MTLLMFWHILAWKTDKLASEQKDFCCNKTESKKKKKKIIWTVLLITDFVKKTLVSQQIKMCDPLF